MRPHKVYVFEILSAPAARSGNVVIERRKTPRIARVFPRHSHEQVAPPIGLNVSRVYLGEAGRNRRVVARAAFGCRFKALSRELTMAGRIVSGLAVIAALAAIGVSAANAQTGAAQITLLYDAFGKTSTLTKDWGF